MSGRRRHTVWDVARVYASVRSADTYEGADLLLTRMILRDPKLREMWADLQTPRDHGLSPMDLAALVLATRSPTAYKHLEHPLMQVLKLHAETREPLEYLEALLENRREEGAIDVLLADEGLNRLIDSEGWAEPPDVFDLFGNEPNFAEQIRALCGERLGRTTDPEARARLHTVLARLDVALSLRENLPRLSEELLGVLDDASSGRSREAPERAETDTEAIQNYSGWLRELADTLEGSLLDEGDTHDQDH